MSNKITVLVVDDHPLFREGVVQSLKTQPDFEVVGEASTAQQAIEMASDFLPDITLLDINIPGGGLFAAQKIATDCPVTRIIMLTASEEDDDVVAALKAGARGYILKGVSSKELTNILQQISAGEVYVTPALATSLLLVMTGASNSTPKTLNTAVSSPLDDLTERERQILELVAAGKSNKEIGLQLHLSEKTVKHHMTNILQKLQVRNRVEAALIAQTEAQKSTKRS